MKINRTNILMMENVMIHEYGNWMMMTNNNDDNKEEDETVKSSNGCYRVKPLPKGEAGEMILKEENPPTSTTTTTTTSTTAAKTDSPFKVKGNGFYTELQRRYLWTDAFAVLNFVSLSRYYATALLEPEKSLATLQACYTLISTVHRTLGNPVNASYMMRPRSDDERLPGLNIASSTTLSSFKGLRIGKVEVRKQSDMGMQYDGMYWHYLDKWIFALCRYAHAAKDVNILRDAVQIVLDVHPYFYVKGHGLRWKINVDMSPIHSSSGERGPSSDDIQGLVSYHCIYETARYLEDDLSLNIIKEYLSELLTAAQSYYQLDFLRSSSYRNQHNMFNVDPLGWGMEAMTMQWISCISSLNATATAAASTTTTTSTSTTNNDITSTTTTSSTGSTASFSSSTTTTTRSSLIGRCNPNSIETLHNMKAKNTYINPNIALHHSVILSTLNQALSSYGSMTSLSFRFYGALIGAQLLLGAHMNDTTLRIIANLNSSDNNVHTTVDQMHVFQKMIDDLKKLLICRMSVRKEEDAVMKLHTGEHSGINNVMLASALYPISFMKLSSERCIQVPGIDE